MVRRVRQQIRRLFADSIAVKRQFLRDNLEMLETARIQETPILVGHVICGRVDAQLFPSGATR
jgi:hypothetical protein